jgi:hypothetical protein
MILILRTRKLLHASEIALRTPSYMPGAARYLAGVRLNRE